MEYPRPEQDNAEERDDGKAHCLRERVEPKESDDRRPHRAQTEESSEQSYRGYLSQGEAQRDCNPCQCHLVLSLTTHQRRSWSMIGSNMTGDQMRRLLGEARLGHLATVTSRGLPHLVPICFVLDGEHVYSAVDRKPKRTQRLQRLLNIEAVPRATLLVDHYEEDWSKLWWIRAEGAATVLEEGEEAGRARYLLAGKYEPYRSQLPTGPVLRIDLDRWTAWEGVPKADRGSAG
jgi:PPOX class probable F420-dependent enzyme